MKKLILNHVEKFVIFDHCRRLLKNVFFTLVSRIKTPPCSSRIAYRKAVTTYPWTCVGLFILGGLGGLGGLPQAPPKLFDQNLPEYCVKDFKVIFHCRI